jgi:hypothetical protein
MEFEVGRWYKAKDITACIRKAFGTRYYSRITYSLQPLPDGSCKIIFDWKKTRSLLENWVFITTRSQNKFNWHSYIKRFFLHHIQEVLLPLTSRESSH